MLSLSLMVKLAWRQCRRGVRPVICWVTLSRTGTSMSGGRQMGRFPSSSLFLHQEIPVASENTKRTYHEEDECAREARVGLNSDLRLCLRHFYRQLFVQKYLRPCESERGTGTYSLLAASRLQDSLPSR